MTTRKLTRRQLNDLIPKMPFNALLGIRVHRVHADGITIECAVRPDLLNGAKVLHGGVTATLADAAVGIALIRHLGGIRNITTVELKVNYFKPVREGKLRARAYLIRVGSTLCVGRVDLFNSAGELTGAGMATYMVLPGR